MADPTKDRLPPDHKIDYSKAKFRTSSTCPRLQARLRAHKSVHVQSDRDLPVADLASAARDGGKEGQQRFHDEILSLRQRRIDSAVARKNGYHVIDHEAEAMSLRSIRDMPALRRALDFNVVVVQKTPDGGERSITSSAFNVLVSSLAYADTTIGAESVPSIADQMVTDIDDVQPNTEIPEALDFGHEDPREEPPPLGETESYREVGAGEDRYTLLSYKDGYQRKFTQEFLDRAPAEAANQLMDLGRGAMEVMELHKLRRIIDFFGSRGTTPTKHVMIRNRVAASLFSNTANTPSARTPNGTRLINNPLAAVANLEALRALLASFRNPRKHPQPALFRVLLVPDAKWNAAWTLLNSAHVPAVFNQENFFGPNGPIRPAILSSPMLDLLTTTSWYGGDPQRQFMCKFRRRPEVAVHGGSDTQAYVDSHQAMQVRIGWDMTVGTRSHVFWAESLDGIVPPGGA